MPGPGPKSASAFGDPSPEDSAAPVLCPSGHGAAVMDWCRTTTPIHHALRRYSVQPDSGLGSRSNRVPVPRSNGDRAIDPPSIPLDPHTEEEPHAPVTSRD